MSQNMFSLVYAPALAQVTALRALGWAALVLAVLGLGHLAASWAENRALIHYRKGRGRGLAMSGAITVLEEIFNPAAEHRIEYQQEEHREPTESGQGFTIEEGTEWRAPAD